MNELFEKYSALVFDWDGTLFNSMPVKIRNLAQVFSDSFDCDSGRVEELYRLYSGIPRKELFKQIAMDILSRDLEQAEYERLSSQFTQANLESFSKSTQLFNWTDPLLKQLKSLKKITAVSSSVPQKELELIIGNFTIGRLLDEILGSTPGFSKGKEHIRYLVDKYGVAREDILFIGDELNDVRLAREAGIQIAVVTTSNSRDAFLAVRPDFIFDSLCTTGGKNG